MQCAFFVVPCWADSCMHGTACQVLEGKSFQINVSEAQQLKTSTSAEKLNQFFRQDQWRQKLDPRRYRVRFQLPAVCVVPEVFWQSGTPTAGDRATRLSRV